MKDLADDLMESITMIRRTRMRLGVAIRTRGEKNPIISMIRTIQIREEEVEDKDMEEESSVGNFFIREKKGIEYLNVPNTNE